MLRLMRKGKGAGTQINSLITEEGVITEIPGGGGLSKLRVGIRIVKMLI